VVCPHVTNMIAVFGTSWTFLRLRFSLQKSRSGNRLGRLLCRILPNIVGWHPPCLFYHSRTISDTQTPFSSCIKILAIDNSQISCIPPVKLTAFYVTWNTIFSGSGIWPINCISLWSYTRYKPNSFLFLCSHCPISPFFRMKKTPRLIFRVW
jgi:hypothetical protein